MNGGGGENQTSFTKQIWKGAKSVGGGETGGGESKGGRNVNCKCSNRRISRAARQSARVPLLNKNSETELGKPARKTPQKRVVKKGLGAMLSGSLDYRTIEKNSTHRRSEGMKEERMRLQNNSKNSKQACIRAKTQKRPAGRKGKGHQIRYGL